MSCSVCLFVCLFDCLSDYLPDRPSACLSICLPPAAAFHPYCQQGFGNNFRRKYTQSRVICQSVVVKVASHVCKFGLFAYLTDYQSIYQSIRPSVCLPPAAAFHPYCPQGLGNNFRRKYTQSRVICQSVVVKVASHVCKSGLFARVGFHGCCPELRQEPALLRVLRKRNSSGKASSDAGPELAGMESCVAMESPQALMCPPLEN